MYGINFFFFVKFSQTKSIRILCTLITLFTETDILMRTAATFGAASAGHYNDTRPTSHLSNAHFVVFEWVLVICDR